MIYPIHTVVRNWRKIGQSHARNLDKCRTGLSSGHQAEVLAWSYARNLDKCRTGLSSDPLPKYWRDPLPKYWRNIKAVELVNTKQPKYWRNIKAVELVNTKAVELLNTKC